MRLGVLDVGSNTVHLLVVDAYSGARPMPAFSHKVTLKLTAQLDGTSLSGPGEKSLRGVVEEALGIAEDKGVEEIIAFATSAVREAVNGEQVLARIREQTGAQINVMTGEEEARLTFLAARRWYGWSAGRLLVFDIGGGSLELATGVDEDPDVALSVPLGAGRMTRQFLPDAETGGRPDLAALARLEDHADDVLAAPGKQLREAGEPDLVAATSKTFRTLARLAGAAPYAAGLRVPRELNAIGLSQVIAFISRIESDALAELQGVSAQRAHQAPAGAVVAQAAMRAVDVPFVRICPWALREGVILRRLDQLEGT